LHGELGVLSEEPAAVEPRVPMVPARKNEGEAASFVAHFADDHSPDCCDQVRWMSVGRTALPCEVFAREASSVAEVGARSRTNSSRLHGVGSGGSLEATQPIAAYAW